MNSKKRTFAAVLALIVLAGAVWWGTARTAPQSSGVIKIGFIGPLTGDAAPIGESTRNAVVSAIDEVNASSTQKYEVIYEDGRCDGPTSASAAQKLINIDKVKFIIGGICSGETLGAAPVAEAAHIILLSPVSSSPDITKAGDYIFRTFASDATSGQKVAEAIWSRGYRSIAVISEQTDYAQALKDIFEARFKELGGTIVTSEGYETTSKDFRSQLTKAKAANPDALYLVPNTSASGQILLSQVKDMGITTPLFSNELVTTPSLLTSGVSNGVIFAEVNFDKNSPAAAAFLDAYTKRFGTMDPSSPPIYGASTYDSVHLLTDLITTYGSNPDTVKGALYAVKDRPGAAGQLTIDRNGDAVREYVLKQVVNGQIVPVTQ
ncbi:MAG: penicillin-binding protein activator [Patescibacteria group bacterium]